MHTSSDEGKHKIWQLHNCHQNHDGNGCMQIYRHHSGGEKTSEFSLDRPSVKDTHHQTY